MPGSVPESMRATVYRAKQVLAVETRPVPAVGEGEVLLRVSHCGICGTDLHLVVEGWGRPDSIGGHEYSGEIVELGAAVSGLAIGDRVVGGPPLGCGECGYCRDARPSLCEARDDIGLGGFQGAFAEYKKISATEALPIPDAVSLREAALCEPLAVALHGTTRSGIRPGQRALVTGAGPIGALVIAVLPTLGVEEIAVSEPSSVRRELAERLGAGQLLVPEDLETPVMPFDLVAEPFHHVFECSGKQTAVEQGLAQLRRGGRLTLLGTGMARPKIDTNRMILNELDVTGAFNYDDGGFAAALELLATGTLPTDLLLERQDVALGDMMEAMHSLAEGRVAGKVLVDPKR